MNKNLETSTRSTHTSRLAAVWADIRNAQYRFIEGNRPKGHLPRRGI